MLTFAAFSVGRRERRSLGSVGRRRRVEDVWFSTSLLELCICEFVTSSANV